MMAAIIIIIINGDNKKKIKYPGCPFQIIYIQFKYQIDSNEKKNISGWDWKSINIQKSKGKKGGQTNIHGGL